MVKGVAPWALTFSNRLFLGTWKQILGGRNKSFAYDADLVKN
jgi:hypothetical protein